MSNPHHDRRFPPIINTLGVPTEERPSARLIRNNLAELDVYLQRLVAAAKLADYCDENIENRYEWMAISVRDAAMTLHHFQYLMGTLRTSITECPTIMKFHDKQKLDDANDMFLDFFPNVDAIRNAVGHVSQRAALSKKVTQHSFTGTYSRGAVEIANSKQATLNIQEGRRLHISWKNKIQVFELTSDSLSKLRNVLDTIYDAFLPVEAGLKGIDLGD